MIRNHQLFIKEMSLIWAAVRKPSLHLECKASGNHKRKSRPKNLSMAEDLQLKSKIPVLAGISSNLLEHISGTSNSKEFACEL